MKTLDWTGLLLGLLLCSCQQETDSGLLSLTLNDVGLINPGQELSLDALGMKVDAIPLETTNDCLIKNISVLEESHDFYWLISDNLIYKFDKSGHFLQHIGAIGQGPKEYVSAKVIQPVEKEHSLYVMDYFGRKMTVYDFDGRFLRSFKLPEETWMDNFRYKNGKVYYLTTGNSVMPDLYCYDVQAARWTRCASVTGKWERRVILGNLLFMYLTGICTPIIILMIRCIALMKVKSSLRGFSRRVR